MELRDIQYFEEIAKHGNLGRAAEALGVGQPALSMSLRRLEQSAHAKLVKRTAKGVELTPVGAALLSHARRLRLARDDLVHEVVEHAQGLAGQIRVGTGPSLAETFIPDVYTTLLKEAPNVSLIATVSGTVPLLQTLRNGDLDLVVNHTPRSMGPGVVQIPLWDDEFVVYASVNHALAKRKSVKLADLAGERWAVTGATALTVLHSLSDTFEERGLSPPINQVVSDSVMLRVRSVANSSLIGFGSRRVVELAALYERLCIIPVRDMQAIRPVAIYHRNDGYVSPAAKRIIEIMKTMSKAIARKSS